MNKYDIIVVGGGHAGVEAAHSVYRLGLRCALVTFEKNKIGQMSCNPAIGRIMMQKIQEQFLKIKLK